MLSLRESIPHVALTNMTLFRKRLHSWFCPLDDGLALSVRLGLDLQGLQAVRTKLRTRRAFKLPRVRRDPLH